MGNGDINMNEVTLDPDGAAVQLYIQRAVQQQLADSPVRYAFTDGWPVELSALEAQEVQEAIRSYQPMYLNMHADEHERLALREVMSQSHYQKS